MANIRKTEPPFAGWLLDLTERETYVLRTALEEHKHAFRKPGNCAAVAELLNKLPRGLPDH